MNIISFLCTLMIVGQDFQSFTDDPSRSQQVQAQAFVSDSSHPQDALIVIGVASTQERTFARNLLESTERSLQQIEVRANSAGYKVIRDEAVIYLISPSHWRDNMLLRLCHLAEQLSTVSPRDPLPISRVSSQSRALLHRWLTSQANRSRPREIAVAERLLADGVVWWSGLVQFEIYAGGQRYRGSFLLECTPSVPPHSVRGNQQSPTASSSLKAKTDDHSEVTILFSREVSENDCVRLSRNYLDLVARELQAAHERYEEVVLQMQRFLVSHFSMPEEWAEGKESPFATLPEWIKSRITEELRSYYAGKATDEIKDLLRGDSVKAAIQPVILIGGFVSEYSFESYGWGLSDLLGAASSQAETREGSLHGYASP